MTARGASEGGADLFEGEINTEGGGGGLAQKKDVEIRLGKEGEDRACP